MHPNVSVAMFFADAAATKVSQKLFWKNTIIL